MFSIAESFGTVGNLENAFREKYANWLILGADHEAVYECYSIESDSGELDYGLGVAIAIRGATPKALLNDNHQTLFVGFDSFLAAIPLFKPPKADIEHRLLRLDGIFLDLVILRNETICVIHELGALIITEDLIKTWSISTDVISDWGIDDEQKILSFDLLPEISTAMM